MRLTALVVLVLGTALGGASSLAAPPPGGGGAGAHQGGGHGYWGGGGYRPGYGGWYGGYPRYGYGWGLSLGYGVGWALSGYPGYYWGSPYYANAYGYPYGYTVATTPLQGWNDEVAYVQQSQTFSTNPAPAQPAAGYWYYCTAPAGYYPYVQQCARPWVQVQPQAAAAPVQ